MGGQENLCLAQKLLVSLASGDSQAVSEFFAEDLIWEVPGDIGALPWLGRKTGRLAITEFVRDSSALLISENFEIHDILVNEHRAVILGELASRVKSTNKLIDTSFMIMLEISNGLITKFRMLEDTLAVSRAARGY